MNLDKILENVDSKDDPRGTISDQLWIKFVWMKSQIHTLVERVREAEIVMEHLRWCNFDGIDECPPCTKDYNNYRKKWVGND